MSDLNKNPLSIQGWKWEILKNNNRVEMNVIGDGVPEIPNLIHKYFRLNSRNVEAFERSALYASTTWQFNDIHEGNPEILAKFHRQVLESMINSLPDTFKDYANSFGSEEGKLIALYGYWARVQGLCCFSRNDRNATLWSYYAGPDGYCLSYDWETFPFQFSKPFPIKYVEKYEDPLPARINHSHQLLYRTFVKLKDYWSHEEEVRCICGTPPGTMAFWTEDRFAHRPDLVGADRLITGFEDSNKKIIYGFKFFERYADFKMSGADGFSIDLNFDESNRHHTRAELVFRILNRVDELNLDSKMVALPDQRTGEYIALQDIEVERIVDRRFFIRSGEVNEVGGVKH